MALVDVKGVTKRFGGFGILMLHQEPTAQQQCQLVTGQGR
jgi:hypothetical protein